MPIPAPRAGPRCPTGSAAPASRCCWRRSPRSCRASGSGAGSAQRARGGNRLRHRTTLAVGRAPHGLRRQRATPRRPAARSCAPAARPSMRRSPRSSCSTSSSRSRAGSAAAPSCSTGTPASPSSRPTTGARRRPPRRSPTASSSTASRCRSTTAVRSGLSIGVPGIVRLLETVHAQHGAPAVGAPVRAGDPPRRDGLRGVAAAASAAALARPRELRAGGAALFLHRHGQRLADRLSCSRTRSSPPRCAASRPRARAASTRAPSPRRSSRRSRRRRSRPAA